MPRNLDQILSINSYTAQRSYPAFLAENTFHFGPVPLVKNYHSSYQFIQKGESENVVIVPWFFSRGTTILPISLKYLKFWTSI